MKKKSDNLIVIIGNGFDLAHKLETGFSHFAEYYKNIIINNLKSSVVRGLPKWCFSVMILPS